MKKKIFKNRLKERKKERNVYKLAPHFSFSFVEFKWEGPQPMHW